ncbi:hypothetical protein KY362_04080 [Candidatus Woesearchaeota archaeon]|nr:hypothetical protein [Candidatus Woesearchaeota archaeon]
MPVDRIVEEFWDDKYGGFRWTKESGVSTVAFQAQGLDFVMVQTRDGKDYNAWCYSEPGLSIFAAMLKYRKQTTGLPHWVDVRHVLGESMESRETAYPVDRIGMDMIFKNDFPVAEDGRIVLADDQMLHVIGGNVEGPLCGFLECGDFVVSSPNQGEEVPVYAERDGALKRLATYFRSLIFDTSDALRVLKAITWFYPDKEFLKSALVQAHDLSDDWMYSHRPR